MTALAIGAFGGLAALGALLRWRATAWHPTLALLALNAAGSFALGLLAASTGPFITALGVGGLGSLTTVSGLAQPTVRLWQHRRTVAVGYLALNLTTCITATTLALTLVNA